MKKCYLGQLSIRLFDFHANLHKEGTPVLLIGKRCFVLGGGEINIEVSKSLLYNVETYKGSMKLLKLIGLPV